MSEEKRAHPMLDAVKAAGQALVKTGDTAVYGHLAIPIFIFLDLARAWGNAPMQERYVGGQTWVVAVLSRGTDANTRWTVGCQYHEDDNVSKFRLWDREPGEERDAGEPRVFLEIWARISTSNSAQDRVQTRIMDGLHLTDPIAPFIAQIMTSAIASARRLNRPQ